MKELELNASNKPNFLSDEEINSLLDVVFDKNFIENTQRKYFTSDNKDDIIKGHQLILEHISVRIDKLLLGFKNIKIEGSLADPIIKILGENQYDDHVNLFKIIQSTKNLNNDIIEAIAQMDYIENKIRKKVEEKELEDENTEECHF